MRAGGLPGLSVFLAIALLVAAPPAVVGTEISPTDRIIAESNGPSTPEVARGSSYPGPPETNWPSPRYGHTMVSHAAADRIVLFGGIAGSGRNDFGSYDYAEPTNETWLYDPSNRSWERMGPAHSPSAREGQAMAYHAASGLVVLFGGVARAAWPDITQYHDDTWVYDPAADDWTRMAPAISPSPRAGHAMAYDEASEQVILFGGDGNNDTWAYELSSDSWVSRTPATSPPRGLASNGMVYHAASGHIMLLRPNGTYPTAKTDVWRYDPARDSWTHGDSSSAPPWRRSAGFAERRADGRLVLFGGDALYHGDNFLPDYTPPLFGRYRDTWAYDVTQDAWTEMEPATDPGGRSDHVMVYHEPSDDIVLFGGVISFCPYFDAGAWAYDLDGNAWALLGPRGPPSSPVGLFARGGDRRADLTWFPPPVVGTSPVVGYRIYWTAFERDSIPPSEPTAIDVGDVLGYSHAGLTNGLAYLYQVGALNKEGEGPRSCFAVTLSRAPPSPPRALRTVAHDGEVLLAWEPPADDGGFPIASYRIYRGPFPVGLSYIAEVESETYRDTDVTNGLTYYYEVVAVTEWHTSPPSEAVSATPRSLWDRLLGPVAIGAAVAIAVAGLQVFRRRRKKERADPLHRYRRDLW